MLSQIRKKLKFVIWQHQFEKWRTCHSYTGKVLLISNLLTSQSKSCLSLLFKKLDSKLRFKIRRWVNERRYKIMRNRTMWWDIWDFGNFHWELETTFSLRRCPNWMDIWRKIRNFLIQVSFKRHHYYLKK